MIHRDIDLLIAEDNPADAELILESLQGRFAERVRIAADGVEALDVLLCRGSFAYRSFEAPPRLVILDVKLPKLDGLEVLRTMKEDERTRPIPVVMLTSSKIDQDISSAYRWGANSYVQKPVEFERFRDAVQSVGRYWLTLNESPPPQSFQVERR